MSNLFVGSFDLPAEFGPDDAQTLQGMLDEHQPRTRESEAAHRQVIERRDTIASVKRARVQELTEVECAYNERVLAAMLEAVDNPALDVAAISEALAALERPAVLLRNVIDFIERIALPDAEQAVLETARNWRRDEHLESILILGKAKAELEGRVGASFGSTFGRVKVFSESIQQLEAISEEAKRQAVTADAQYHAFVAARESAQQLRLTNGLLTRAEAIFAQAQLSKQNGENE